MKQYPDNTELFRLMADRKAAMTEKEKQVAWQRMQPMLEAIRPIRERWLAQRKAAKANEN